MRPDLIIPQGLQLIVDVEIDSLHHLDDPWLPHLSIHELTDAGLTLQDRDSHTKWNTELSFQRGFRHRIDQCIGNIGVASHVYGFDIAVMQIVVFDQIEDQILGGMG